MQKLEGIEIIEPIGTKKRKFGHLYLGKHSVTGERVVIKEILKTNKNNVACERLIHESTFNFKFKGLPEILHFSENEESIILVRKHVEGVTIKEYWKNLKKKSRLSFLIQFVEKLNIILDHLTESKIVHGDIKPGNIIIEETEDFNVHLLDFGLSIRLGNLDNRKILFPLGYAAPELLLNHLELVDHRADQFSLGVLIWQLYCNKLPLTHPNPAIFTNLQLTHPLPENNQLPKKMHEILAKMCFKHSFKLPPNRMEKTEVQEHLSMAMNQRYSCSQEYLVDMKKLLVKKSFLPKNIFSKS